MTVDADGKFIVSVFDKNDPDDLRKKENYLKWKKMQTDCSGGDDENAYFLGDNDQKLVQKMRKEEKQLIISSLLLFSLYVIVRIMFGQPGMTEEKET